MYVARIRNSFQNIILSIYGFHMRISKNYIPILISNLNVFSVNLDFPQNIRIINILFAYKDSSKLHSPIVKKKKIIVFFANPNLFSNHLYHQYENTYQLHIILNPTLKYFLGTRFFSLKHFYHEKLFIFFFKLHVQNKRNS